MLKLALSLVFVVGLAVAAEVDEFRWETIPVAENASQCIYRPEVRSLTCRGSSGLVECPAALEFGSLQLEVLGIRAHPIKSFVTPVESRVYELYPRKLDNQTYGNYSIVTGDKTVELYLYYGETNSTGTVGVRITDLKCYSRLIDVVFSVSKAHHVVPVQGVTTGEVELFGEILIAEKPANKRWLGFGFPWLGFGLGMWGWGLGWGLPFWG
jgi:hypothetical protein